MEIDEIKHLAQWINTQSHSPDKANAELAKKCIKELNQTERQYLLNVLTGTKHPEIPNFDKQKFEAKLKALTSKNPSFIRESSFLKSLGRIWDNIFNGRISSDKIFKQIALDQNVNNTGGKTVLTSEHLDHFSDFISKAENKGQYVIHHATTFPENDLNGIPTDHAGVKAIKNGYHVVLADGMGHSDPEEIGRVAAEVVNHALSETLTSRLIKDREKNHQANYVEYVKEQHKKYQFREATCLLEAEVVKNPNGGVDVTVCQCGDSDCILVNEEGKVVFATKDIKKEKVSPDSERTKGLLGIGGAFYKEKLNHTVVNKLHFDEKVFLIACSDGLTDHFRNDDGTLNTKSFEKAIETGKFNQEPDTTEPLSLNCFNLGASLRNAAFDAAAKTERNGDDTTIVVLSLN